MTGGKDPDRHADLVDGYGQRAVDALHAIVKNCALLDEVASAGRDAFQTDWQARYSAEMCLVRIGECVGRLSGEFRVDHPGQPWETIYGLRNYTAHSISPVEVDQDIVWNTIIEDVPALRRYVEQDILGS